MKKKIRRCYITRGFDSQFVTLSTPRHSAEPIHGQIHHLCPFSNLYLLWIGRSMYSHNQRYSMSSILLNYKEAPVTVVFERIVHNAVAFMRLVELGRCVC